MFIAKISNFCAEFFRSLVFPGIFLSDGCSQVKYVNTANFKFNTFLNWTHYYFSCAIFCNKYRVSRLLVSGLSVERFVFCLTPPHVSRLSVLCLIVLLLVSKHIVSL
jgi:hypothetical protein